VATDKFVVKNGLLVGTNTDDGVNLVQVNGTISATNLIYSGTISGNGSGLTNVNATTLDSIDSTQFLRSDVADTKTSGNLSFSDNVRAVFGTGNDLQIYHDGSNSFIQDAGTGNLRIDATNLDIRNGLGTKTYATFVDGGSVTLYHNNAVKLATTATGITVTGSVTASEIIAASTDLDITGNAIISGNLTVNGTTTTLNTSTVTTEDSVIVLNSGQTTPANDIGLILQRFSSPTTANYNVAIVWDEGSDRLMFGATAETGADADITVSSEWMSITGAGNVGIGVTNPAFSSGTGLEIQRSGTATLRLDSLTFATELRGLTDGTQLLQLSAGYLDLGTSGTTRMRITSGGNIGIGTTSPASMLHLRSDSATVLTIESDADNNDEGDEAAIHFLTDGGLRTAAITGGNATTETSANGNYNALNLQSQTIRFLTSNTQDFNSATTSEKMRIQASGNVGIGNNNPNAKLVVGANAGVTSEGLVASFYNGNDTTVSIISNTNNNGAGPRLRLFENNSNRFGTELFYDSGLNSFSIVNYSNNVETGRIHLLSNGNVGIGTNNPSTILHINGDLTITDRIIHSGDSNTQIRFPANDTVTVETNAVERMRIDSNGNVGIGTVSPSTKLDVIGTVRSSTTDSVSGQYTTIAYQFSEGRGWGYNFLDDAVFYNAAGGIIPFLARTTEVVVNESSNDIDFRVESDTNTHALFVNGSDGNVGIGTNNPTEKLHIKGGSLLVQTDAGTDILADFSSNVSGNGRIQLVSNAGNPAIVLSDFGNGTGGDQAWGLVANDRNAGSFTINWYGTSLPSTNITSGVEMFTIVGDGSVGNVGIGSTNPQAKLDVNGNVIVKSDITYTSPNNTHQIVTRMLDTDTLSFSGDSGQLFSITDTMTGTIFAVNDVSGVPSIEVDDDGTIRFAETFGNVLIGTATDDGTNKLQVVGNTKVTGNLEVTGTVTGTFSGNITGTASNANLLDNLDSTQFLRSDTSGTLTGSLTITSDLTIADRIIHAGDTNTQIRFPANDTVTVETSGTERLRITSAGNVGIGTGSPIGRLQVVSGSGVEPFRVGSTGAGSNYATFLHHSSGDIAYWGACGGAAITAGTSSDFGLRANQGAMLFATNGNNERMRITSAGNVGIGTTNPTEKLEISSSSGGTAIRITNTGFGGGLVAVGNSSTSSLGSFGIITEDVGSGVFNDGVFTINLGADGSIAERFRIASRGNVGIGITNPATTLDVNGATSIRGDIFLTGTPTTANQARTIHFTAFDKETVGDVSDAAYIQHTTNQLGHTGSVLVISSMNDVQDGIAFQTNGSSPLKHNSKNIPRIGVSDSAPGATNIVGDLWWDSNQGSLHIYYGTAWVEVNPYLGTTANPQFNSLGVGTAASGTTGEIRATNDVTAYYSDARLKDFEGTIDNAIDKVKQLNGYYFRENKLARNLGYNNPNRQVGVSAQEVQTVLPEVVTTAPISDEYLTVKYEKMIPLLIEAIKEQQTMIDELREEIKKLKDLSN
jgi:hypothetical protein